MAWTDARVETLKTLWADGRPASQIAAMLGDVSRNAVIGKIHRLDLAGRKAAPRQPALYRPARRDSTLLYTIPKPPKPEQINCAAKSTAAKYAPGPTGGVLFADLENGMCKYPLGARLDKAERFCGATVLKTATRTYPYCAECCALAYRPYAASSIVDYRKLAVRKAA